MTVVLVAIGGGVGAGVRYLAGRHLHSYRSFPVPTFTVNVVGCFILGVLAGLAVDSTVFAALGVGFCGGLTTYSTFATEAVGLARVQRTRTSMTYVVASLLVGIACAWVGYRLAA